jgi:hypothetical protein
VRIRIRKKQQSLFPRSPLLVDVHVCLLCGKFRPFLSSVSHGCMLAWAPLFLDATNGRTTGFILCMVTVCTTLALIGGATIQPGHLRCQDPRRMDLALNVLSFQLMTSALLFHLIFSSAIASDTTRDSVFSNLRRALCQYTVTPGAQYNFLQPSQDIGDASVPMCAFTLSVDVFAYLGFATTHT